MKYILHKAGTRKYFCCGGYEAPIFSNLLAAWTFSTPEKAKEAADLMVKHSVGLRLDVYLKPNMSDIGFDESEVANLIKGLDELALKLHPLPYDEVGNLRDAAMKAKEFVESALIDVGSQLIKNAIPVATVKSPA